MINIMDIGASGGLDERWIRLAKRVRPIVCEPDERALAGLETLLRRDFADPLVLPVAVGDGGPQHLYLCKRQEVSSLLEPDVEILNRFPDAGRFAVEKQIALDTKRVDDLVAQNAIGDVHFLKVDTQGSELEILRSGERTLQRTIGIDCEVEFTPIYKDQPCFDEIHRYLTGLGFELFDIKRCFWTRDRRTVQRKGQLIFGDALYLRPPEDPIFADASLAQSAALIYAAYGYQDLLRALQQLHKVSGIDELLTAPTFSRRSLRQRLRRRAVGLFDAVFGPPQQVVWDEDLGGR